MLSQREWQFAKSENFMFTVPVQVAWESLDSSMISRLFVRHPHLGLSLPNPEPKPKPNPKPKPKPKPDPKPDPDPHQVRHPHLGLSAAQLARRVLVFHRGTSVLQKTACFFEEKLDMLLDQLFTEPFR